VAVKFAIQSAKAFFGNASSVAGGATETLRGSEGGGEGTFIGEEAQAASSVHASAVHACQGRRFCGEGSMFIRRTGLGA
jgi:hypothetical protein